MFEDQYRYLPWLVCSFCFWVGDPRPLQYSATWLEETQNEVWRNVRLITIGNSLCKDFFIGFFWYILVQLQLSFALLEVLEVWPVVHGNLKAGDDHVGHRHLNLRQAQFLMIHNSHAVFQTWTTAGELKKLVNFYHSISFLIVILTIYHLWTQI